MTDLSAQNGLDPRTQMLQADATTLNVLIQQLQNHVLFIGLAARPLPAEVLEDGAERLERLALVMRQRAGEGL